MAQCGRGTRAGEDFGPLRGYRQDRAPARTGFHTRNSTAMRSNRNGPNRPARPAASAPPATAGRCTTPTPCSTPSAPARPTGTAWPITTTRATLSPRHTYRHVLGRPLTPGNSGALQWGEGVPRAARGGLDRVPPRAETRRDLRVEREGPHSRRRAARGQQLARGHAADAGVCLHAPRARALSRPAPRRQRASARRLRVRAPAAHLRPRLSP